MSFGSGAESDPQVQKEIALSEIPNVLAQLVEQKDLDPSTKQRGISECR